MPAGSFVNRTDELAALHGWWAESERLGVVWGRRRVGKTALIQRFASDLDVPVVFHTGVGRPAVDELAQLSRGVAGVLAHPVRDLAARPYVSWDDALEDLAVRGADRPILLVLDEFPELTAGSPELPGLLRALTDRTIGRTRLRILLCGSAVRYMQQLQEDRAPLFGRFDLALQVHPFRPHEAALMLPDLTPEHRALVYGLVGGTPLYLSWWNQGEPVGSNVERLAGTPDGRLLTEGRLVLATEADHGDLPAKVLHAIAEGRTTYGEIKTAVRAEPARTLDRLVALRLVERLEPVTERGRGRRASYRIVDNFLAFYLGLLTRHRGEIERGLGPSILPVLLAGLDDHMGPRWEEMFRQHLRRLAVAGTLAPDVVAIGPWWSSDSQTEIDAVALAGRSRTPVLVGEAKWARNVDGAALAIRLRRRAERVPGADADRIGLAVCARSTVSGAPDGTVTVTAADVMGER
ncbi:MAG: ATP-binding protein [Pseudonocardia sp.]